LRGPGARQRQRGRRRRRQQAPDFHRADEEKQERHRRKDRGDNHLEHTGTSPEAEPARLFVRGEPRIVQLWQLWMKARCEERIGVVGP
jgi:hypothetical protein